ncbi:hypothetical protein BaRGS_00019787, partial [Batillaria attramentaria]
MSDHSNVSGPNAGFVYPTTVTTFMTSESDGAVPNSYISDDERLTHLLAFQVAVWIDYIYVPICAGFGIVGNILTFCVLLFTRLSRTSTSVYMAALSVSDILVQIVNILFLVRKFEGHEVLRHGTCGLVFFLLYFSIHYNVIVMIGMTVERYLAIRASGWCTPRRARIAVVVICIITFVIDVHHLVIRQMSWNDVLQADVCTPVGEANQLFAFMIWPWIDGALYCYIPFASLVVLNVLIVQQMKSARKFRDTSTCKEQGDQSRQVTTMLLLVTCAFLVLIGPMAVIIVVERYYWARNTPEEQAAYHLTRVVCNNLSYTNHAINFTLYCLSGNRFRHEFLGLFRLTSRARSGDSTGRQMKESDSNATAVRPPQHERSLAAGNCAITDTWPIIPEQSTEQMGRNMAFLCFFAQHVVGLIVHNKHWLTSSRPP